MNARGNNKGLEDTNDSIAQLVAEGLKEADVSSTQRANMFSRVLERIAASSPAHTQTIRVATMPWQPVCPGVWTKLMKTDPTRQMQVALLRVDPGGVVPAHTHHREEEWLVLQGEVLLGEHRVGQGDFHFAHVGSHHPDLTAPIGALLVVRSEIRA